MKDISLDSPKAVLGLLGRNRPGKSPLMRILATLQEPDEGSARLASSSIPEPAEARRAQGAAAAVGPRLGRGPLPR